MRSLRAKIPDHQKHQDCFYEGLCRTPVTIETAHRWTINVYKRFATPGDRSPIHHTPRKTTGLM